MNKNILAILGLLLLLVLPAASLGCAGGEAGEPVAENGDGTEPASGGDAEGGDAGDEGEDGEAKKEEAVPVEVAELVTGEIESVLRFSANLEAENAVGVYSQARRLVRQLVVEEGDRVRKGQVLLRLQDEEQRSALAKVDSQIVKAEREYDRQRRLFEQKLISEQMFNDATYELEQLRIAHDDAERELSYTEVRAPISGTVTERMVNLGDQVQLGQHLFDLVDFASIVARIYVPEKHIDRLSKGLQARLTPQAGADRQYGCAVKRIAPIVDPASGTVKVTVDVGRRDGLRPGMYVNVDLITARRGDAVLVPKRALVYDNDQIFVYRLGEERRVERVFIEPKLTDKHNVEPREGLDPGDQIVVAGQAGLKDGALVRLPGDEVPGDEDGSDDGSVERASL